MALTGVAPVPPSLWVSIHECCHVCHDQILDGALSLLLETLSVLVVEDAKHILLALSNHCTEVLVDLILLKFLYFLDSLKTVIFVHLDDYLSFAAYEESRIWED